MTRDPDSADDERSFRRFALAFATTFFGVLAALFVVLVVIDPYDTGRFPTFMPTGVSDESPRTGNVSRARDPRFDAAVFGNSRAMLLNPRHLSDLTKLNFIQLVTPGSGPREAMIMMRYFLQFHTRISAVVLSVDERWCTHQVPIPVYFQFPFELYGGDLEYLTSLLSTRVVAAAKDRVEFALGRKALYDPTGFFDYETGRVWNFHPAASERARLEPPKPPSSVFFPALDQLPAVLDALPSGTPVILLMAPVYHLMLQPIGGVGEAELRECKMRLAQLAKARPHTNILDYLSDTPLSRDPENFMDIEHFRLRVARMIEVDIAKRIDAAYNAQE